MKNNFITKIIGATLAFAMMIGGAVGINAAKEAKEVNAAESTASWAISASNKLDTNKKTDTFEDSEGNTWTWVSDKNPGAMQNSNTCQQIGSNGNPATVTFSTSEITDKIKSVTVECASYQAKHTVAITVGSTSYLAATATPQWTTVGSKTGTGNSTGEIVISFTPGNNARAMYIKSITVVHEPSNQPTVTASTTAVFLRTGGSGEEVTATGSNFAGTVSYSWAYQSGTDCVDLTNPLSATVTMTPKSSITELSTGVYRVTASYDQQVATTDVNVTVDNGGIAHPYTVAEARAAINSGNGLENAYVMGIVYKVDSYNSTNKTITYWISDDGTSSTPLEVYNGLAVENGTPFSSKNDIAISDIVVVKGTLTKYNSTYEFESNNHLVTKTSVASIAVKTAPEKVEYNSNECFDPTGLVITATYGDSTTKDYSYAQFTSSFTFDPSTATELTNQDHVTISLFGQETTQAITVNVRTITDVDLMGDMTKKNYFTVDSWDLTGLYLSITWNTGLPNPTTVNLADVDPSNYEFDETNPRLGLTQLYIYGMYEGFEFEKTITGISVTVRPIADILRTADTSLSLTSTSYTDFSKKTNTLSDIESNATWAGKAACNTSKNNALQLNGNTRGIYTTASSGQYIKSVSVDFYDDNGKELYFYGSNVAFTAVSQIISTNEDCTLIATLKDGTTSANVAGNYKYVYIYSNGAIYMNSITVLWKTVGEEIEESITTNTELSYRYTKDGDNYTFSDVSMRFGGLISKDLWAELDTGNHLIEGFGVMFTSTNVVHAPDSIKSKAGEAVAASANNDYANTLVNFYMPKTSMATPAEDGDDYYWNLFFSVDFDEISINKYYVAAAYIKVDGEYVFMKEVKYSVTSLAQDYLDHRNCDGTTAEGSLAKLASLSPAE